MAGTVPEDSKIVFSGELPPTEERFATQIPVIEAGLSGEQFRRAYEEVCRLYNLKSKVFLEEIRAIVDEIVLTPPKGWTLVALKTGVGSKVVPAANIVLKSPEGMSIFAEATGDSSIDAIYSAIQHATGIHVFLSDFSYGNITSGAGAMGRATVTVDHHGREVSAFAYSIDILEAAAKAFLIAINIIAAASENQN